MSLKELQLMKFNALLLLAKILKDEDSAAIADKTNCIPKFVEGVKKASERVDWLGRHRYFGLSVAELVEGLSNLAVNDENKLAIFRADALPVLFPLLESDDNVEKKMALRCIWQCSFQPEVREAIRQNDEHMAKLRHILQNDENKDLLKDAAGALWVIEETVAKQSTKQGHVFLSYNWRHQEIVIRLRDTIRAAGYEVWMDIDNMEDSMFQCIAEAVENAFLVLICYSEEYKRSPMCKKEAEYTSIRGINVQFLRMTHGYKPDGWLGFIIGARLYIDLSLTEYPFEQKAVEVIAKIKKCEIEDKHGLDDDQLPE